MTEPEVRAVFESAGALLHGHFLLSSGRHSDTYLQCALVLKDPRLAETLGRALAERLRDTAPDVVLAPAVGGILVAHEVARALGVCALFTEREAGSMRLRRGFGLAPEQRALVVEDVYTTGASVREVAQVVAAAGARLAGVGCLVFRGESRPAWAPRFEALLELQAPSWPPEACPLERPGAAAAVKPGSRDLQPAK